MKQLLLENKNLYAYRILEMTGTRERKRKELARSAQKLKPHSKCFIHALSAAESLILNRIPNVSSMLYLQPSLSHLVYIVIALTFW